MFNVTISYLYYENVPFNATFKNVCSFCYRAAEFYEALLVTLR